MHRARLRNLFYKNRTKANEARFKSYRNYCVSLVKKEKKNFFSNLDLKVFEDNKKFWKNIKPLFSDKSKTKSRITLIEDEKVITSDEEIATKLNDYYIEAVQNLNIKKFSCDSISDQTPVDENQSEHDIIEKIINTYKNHPSILKIKENVKIEK